MFTAMKPCNKDRLWVLFDPLDKIGYPGQYDLAFLLTSKAESDGSIGHIFQIATPEIESASELELDLCTGHIEPPMPPYEPTLNHYCIRVTDDCKWLCRALVAKLPRGSADWLDEELDLVEYHPGESTYQWTLRALRHLQLALGPEVTPTDGLKLFGVGWANYVNDNTISWELRHRELRNIPKFDIRVRKEVQKCIDEPVHEHHRSHFGLSLSMQN